MRDKQIEEMASIIHHSDKNYNNIFPSSLNECLYKHGGVRTNAGIALYKAGYRKASDVARGIFEEIEKLISSECLVIKDEEGIRGYVDASVHYILAELKKKYTEGKSGHNG